MSLESVRREAVNFLSREQAEDGGFYGQASVSPSDFEQHRLHPTPFFTALMLTSLRQVAGTGRMRKRMADFLLAERSDNWSWNYWLRDSHDARSRPYPDDLDDTACALAALAGQDAELIDGEVLGHVARLLIMNETAAGGPYGTWLVDDSLLPAWHDLDLAVNANIGFFLSLQKVQAGGLQAYVSSQLEREQLTSSYYLGRVPLLYFLGRWYKGSAAAKLSDLIEQALASYKYHDNPLSLALLISAGSYMHIDDELLGNSLEYLLATRSSGHWPARALYYEPPIDGVRYYAGSAALTTAFALEALTAFHDNAKAEAAPQTVSKKPAKRTARAGSQLTAYPELLRRYRHLLHSLVSTDRDGQITAMATRTAEASGRQLAASKLEHLNQASIHGWAAYTIYDTFLDEEANTAMLGVANYCLRQTIEHFRAALPDEIDFQRQVLQALDRVDGANSWEVVHARAAVRDHSILIQKLPDYGNLSQLAERSIGHSLAAQGTLLAAGYKLDSPQQQSLQLFFHNFLIARQLNDDAHDWEEDLQRGHLSAVVTALIADYAGTAGTLDLAQDLSALRVCFWEKTILDIASLIRQHAESARTALAACTALTDPQPFLAWLKPLEVAAERSLHGRAEAKKFMQSYGGQ